MCSSWPPRAWKLLFPCTKLSTHVRNIFDNSTSFLICCNCFYYLKKDPVDNSSVSSRFPLNLFLLDGDVLLAYDMNGETLPASHGFPIRSEVHFLSLYLVHSDCDLS